MPHVKHVAATNRLPHTLIIAQVSKSDIVDESEKSRKIFQNLATTKILNFYDWFDWKINFETEIYLGWENQHMIYECKYFTNLVSKGL